jgi:hypothetical protein
MLFRPFKLAGKKRRADIMTNDNDRIHAVNNANHSSDNLPPLVQQIKDNSLSILTSNLDTLFSACDDMFFNLSSRAASNNEQNLYFESMRELRIKKNGVITLYRQHIEQCFTDCSSRRQRPVSNSPRLDNHDEGLSLVQYDEIEQNVAINSMISKARSNNQEALYQLNTRLDYLLQANTINQNNNPLDPQQLCQSFAKACELLDINIKAKIILYKQLDRLVIGRLAGIYSHANDLLINAGIIPNIIRSTSNKNPSEAKSSNQADHQAQKPRQGTYEQAHVTLDDLSYMLANIRSLGISNIPNYQSYSANPGPAMSNEELLAAISLLQQQLISSAGYPQHEFNIRDLVDSVLTATNPAIPQAVKQTDDDVINLVAMFFDFVLDDRNLPVAMQAIIGRLQIPILKTALKDSSFFNNNQHPARKLVNCLAETSIGFDEFSDLSKDKVYQKVVQIVHDITESSHESNALFANKLQELEQFIAKNQRRSALIEKRTSQAAEGKAKTEEARRATQTLLLEKLKHTLLPPTISSFLIDQWQQLLVITHLKHGDSSKEWLDAAQLVQDMVWACQPQQDEKSRQRLNKIKAHLITRISDGLSTIINTEEERTSLIQQIEATIVDVQSSNVNHCDIQPLSASQATALGHTPGSGTKAWKDMSALERQQTRNQNQTYEYIKKAEELPLNTWLSYEDHKEGRVLRCKLSAKIEASDSYIFTNRFGFKVLEKSRKDFAYDMQKGRAQPLALEPIFERTMTKILGNLKQAGTTSSNPA